VRATADRVCLPTCSKIIVAIVSVHRSTSDDQRITRLHIRVRMDLYTYIPSRNTQYQRLLNTSR